MNDLGRISFHDFSLSSRAFPSYRFFPFTRAVHPGDCVAFHPFHQNEQSLPAGVKVGKEYVERNNLTNGTVSPLENPSDCPHVIYVLRYRGKNIFSHNLFYRANLYRNRNDSRKKWRFIGGKRKYVPHIMNLKITCFLFYASIFTSSLCSLYFHFPCLRYSTAVVVDTRFEFLRTPI